LITEERQFIFPVKFTGFALPGKLGTPKPQ
jgi:hypothetical protein